MGQTSLFWGGAGLTRGRPRGRIVDSMENLVKTWGQGENLGTEHFLWVLP